MRKVFSLLMAVMILLSLATPAFAASTVTVKKDTFGVTPGSGYTDTDLFTNFKNMMPGDTLTDTITIVNRLWGYDYIRVYLEAVPHVKGSNDLTYSESYEEKDQKDEEPLAGRDETIASMEDFLSQLTLTVKKGSTELYKGEPHKLEGKTSNRIYLGSIRRNPLKNSMKLDLQLHMPIDLDNEYADRVGEVDWRITIEGRDDANPKTGDYIITGAVAALIVSAAALVVLFIIKKRKKD